MKRALLVTVLAACVESFSPNAPASPFEPSGWEWRYRLTQVEMCSGLAGDFDRIQWFTVPGAAVDAAGHPAAWVRPHSIYLAEAAFTYDAGSLAWLVRHEILHDVLGSTTHDAPAWEACGLSPR